MACRGAGQVPLQLDLLDAPVQGARQQRQGDLGPLGDQSEEIVAWEDPDLAVFERAGAPSPVLAQQDQLGDAEHLTGLAHRVAHFAAGVADAEQLDPAPI